MECNLEILQAHMDDFLYVLSVERNLAPRTLEAYRSDFRGLLNWIRFRKVTVLDDAAVFAYFSYLQDEVELSARSIRRKYVSLGEFFNYLNEYCNIRERFFRFSSRKFQIPKSLPKTLSKEEVSLLISSTTRDFQNSKSGFQRRLALRNMCMIEIIYCLGLRIGEAAALNINDYNKNECSMLIHGKGNKERMLFISSPVVCQKISAWLIIRKELDPQDDSFFVNKYGKRLGIYGMEKIFSKYQERAKINPNATPHFLRHSFATQLLNNGADIRDVQEILGHSSIVTTQIYTEVSLTRKKEVLLKCNGRNFINPS